MWCASARRQSQRPRCPTSVAGTSIEPVNAACDLRVFIDSDVGAATHFHVASLPYDSFASSPLTSMTASVLFVHSMLDYGNAYLSVFLPILQRRLQAVSYCCSSSGVSTSSLRPRQRCPRDKTLAASPGAGEFQTCAGGISCSA